jgi:uncharacterized protein
MNEGPRFVFDNGVLVGAAIKADSIPRRAVEFGFQSGQVLASAATIAELTDVLRRPKLSRYLSSLVREKFLAEFATQATHVVPSEPIRECRDPKDDMFLELAVAGGAACIVTGDADLLVLDPFRDIPILTPRDFLERAW